MVISGPHPSINKRPSTALGFLTPTWHLAEALGFRCGPALGKPQRQVARRAFFRRGTSHPRRGQSMFNMKWRRPEADAIPTSSDGKTETSRGPVEYLGGFTRSRAKEELNGGLGPRTSQALPHANHRTELRLKNSNKVKDMKTSACSPQRAGGRSIRGRQKTPPTSPGCLLRMRLGA